MRIAMISDPHMMWDAPQCRTDNVWETSEEKMNFVLRYCSDNYIVYLLVAGDLTDKPRSWIYLPKIMSLFEKYSDDVTVLSVYGQHDAYMREARSSTILGALDKARLVTKIGKYRLGLGIDVYGCSYEDAVPMPDNDGAMNILVVHAPISVVEEKYDNALARKFLEMHAEYNAILCGDIHKRFCVKDKKGRFIVNTGPMMRKSADLYEHKPAFAVWDTSSKKLDMIDIPHSPSSEVMTLEHLEKGRDLDTVLDEFIRKIKRGIGIRYDKLSKTFMKYAEENGIELELRDSLVSLLREVENVEQQ